MELGGEDVLEIEVTNEEIDELLGKGDSELWLGKDVKVVVGESVEGDAGHERQQDKDYAARQRYRRNRHLSRLLEQGLSIPAECSSPQQKQGLGFPSEETPKDPSPLPRKRKPGYATLRKRRKRQNRRLRQLDEVARQSLETAPSSAPSADGSSEMDLVSESVNALDAVHLLDSVALDSESAEACPPLSTEEAVSVASTPSAISAPTQLSGVHQLILVDSHCHWDRMMHPEHWGCFTTGKALPGDIQCIEQYVSSDSTGYKPAIDVQLEYMVAVFCDPQSWELIPNVLGDQRIFFTVGIHPQHCGKRLPMVAELKELGLLLQHPRCVGLGEIGLDAHHAKTVGAQDRQLSALGQLLDMVSQFGKPLTLHCRGEGACDPFDSLLQICKRKVRWDHPMHFHSFSGSAAQAWEWQCSFPRTKFGFGGAITRPGPAKDRALEVLRSLSLDCILLETDAPYQVPVGCKRPNHPWNLASVAQEVLHARPDVGSLRAVAAFSRMNACSLYHLW